MKSPLLALVLSLQAALPLCQAAQPASVTREPGLGAPQDVPRLIAVLQNADASLYDKARACEQLAVVGTVDAIPALVALLPEERLSVYARGALESIPGAAAGEALRQALSTLQGKALIGVIHSLASRREARAVARLSELAQRPADGVAADALIALGRIAAPESLPLLRNSVVSGPEDLRPAAAEACLLYAERRIADGDAAAASPLYDAVRAADVPVPLRLAAARGAILSRGTAGLPLLLDEWRSSDPARQDLASRVSRELPDPVVARALADELAKVRPSVQVKIIRTLVDRNEGYIRGAIEALTTAEDASVRLASLQALGTLGGPTSVPVLLASLSANRSPEESDAAAASLTQIKAANADRAIMDLLVPPAPIRARLIDVLGQRKATVATRELIRQAADADPAVSRAAFDALAAVARAEDLPAIIQAARSCPDAASREKAERAMYAAALQVSDATQRSAPLAEALGQPGDPEARCALLQVLAMLADSPAYEAVATAYRDRDQQVRDTALRLLVNWPDNAPAPLLLNIFTSTPNEVHRALALRGLVNTATLWTEEPAEANASRRPPRQVIRWLATANAAVRNEPDEKRTILSGLGSLNCAEGLRLLQPYLDDATVRREAMAAVIQATKGLTTSEEALLARTLLEKVAATTDDDALRRQARENLRTLPAN